MQISLARLISTQLNWLNKTHSSQKNSIEESTHLNPRNWTQRKLA